MVEEREQGCKLLHDIGVFLLLLDLVYFYVECLSLEEIFDKLYGPGCCLAVTIEV